MKTKFIILILMLSVSSSYAQQDAQFTQYMYNTININPAYAGTRDVLSVFALHRNQWGGLDGAPTTNAASINTPIKGSSVGLGLSIVNDRIGPADENNIAVDFSYSVSTSNTYKLSFGIKATANLLNIDFAKLNQHYPGDQAFETNVDNKLSPNIGAGIYLHSDNSYIGLSAPNMLETKHYDKYANIGANSHVSVEKIHYYFIAGHVFDLDESVKFKPSVLVKMVKGTPLQVDLSGNFLINEKFTAGVAYRLNAAVSALVGFQASDSWFIGYGYDMDTSKLANYNSGTHELFLRFEMFKKYDKIISPRFF